MTFNSTMLRTITEYHIDYGCTHKTLTWSTNTRFWFQVCSGRDESLPEAAIDDEKDGDEEGWHLAGVNKGVRPEKTKGSFQLLYATTKKQDERCQAGYVGQQTQRSSPCLTLPGSNYSRPCELKPSVIDASVWVKHESKLSLVQLLQSSVWETSRVTAFSPSPSVFWDLRLPFVNNKLLEKEVRLYAEVILKIWLQRASDSFFAG